MWWDGHPVADDLARAYMAKEAESFVTVRDALVPDGELSERAQEFLDRADTAQLESMPMRRMRRRLGGSNYEFERFLARALDVLGGHTSELSVEDLQFLERGIGMDRARADKLATTGAPWLDGDIRDDFVNIARVVDVDALRGSLENVTDDQLRHLRDQTKALCSVITNLGAVLRDTAGFWAFGYGSSGAFIDDMVARPDGQAAILLFIVRLTTVEGDLGLGGGLGDLAGQAAQASATRQMHDALVALRDAVPEVAAAVPLKWFGKAMSDPTWAAKAQQAFVTLREDETIRAKIDGFFADHPEHRATPPEKTHERDVD
jgi:hypothetical protein